MTKLLASLAFVLALAAPASAFAQGFGSQGFDAPRVDRTDSRSFFGMPAWVDSAREGDALTTGSIGPRLGDEAPVRTGRALSRTGSLAR